MPEQIKRGRNAILFSIAAAIVGGLALAPAPAHAALVLPATAQPFQYTLGGMAQLTAVYNTGQVSGNPATPAPPNTPFTLVTGFGPYTEVQGTYSYVPVYFADNSAPADPNFPTNLADQAGDAAYLDNLLSSGFGISSLFIQVDGVTTLLDDSYTSGVTTPPLLDGTPAGTSYIVAAAFITPLSVGQHTVDYGGVINGSDVVFVSNDVTVTVPEPTGIAALAAAAVPACLRRRRR